MLELFPFLRDVKVNRQWAGMADMTPDFAPIMGMTPVAGLLSGLRLGHLGLQGHAGLRQDHESHGRERYEPIRSSRASRFDRFVRFALTGEKGAASVGH